MEAFEKFFHEITVSGISVPSGVSEQPFDEETYVGAENRARELFRRYPDADYFVGIEGGVQKISGIWFGFGAVAILDKKGRIGHGTSPQYELPESIVKQLQSGKELGTVIDEMSGETNSKQKGGAIGFFTGGVFGRKDLYVTGIITALIPFLNKEIFFNEK